MVKGNAIVQGGANLSGNVVVGGDAEPSIACGSGTYLMFRPERGCDGGGGEADVNPPHGTFTDEELAITDGGQPPTTTTPTTTTTTTTTTAPPAGRCTATQQVTSQWQDGFQAEITVRAGASPITNWTVTWTPPAGQSVTQAWNATVTANGGVTTARNVTWNGTLGAGAGTTFGYISTGTATTPTLSCTTAQ
ncbi:hypothetical protein ALI22I_15855 [Saccharothrix sp. ALI-22-I]|uniref:cellulose binding domain-containing protein n=1 Tax=Saccharothrix sp. ALI-22-I TaxID=1933778 RepID=UPI00097C9A09|nr:cellulose binding domain-containing protein [Saccharothrix sp. ALI-22-I]ONI89485.1 hypothetical protein ALI22I_15855 [Saccharothrix sp. ALI-22-I]